MRDVGLQTVGVVVVAVADVVAAVVVCRVMVGRRPLSRNHLSCGWSPSSLDPPLLTHIENIHAIRVKNTNIPHELSLLTAAVTTFFAF